MGESSGLEKIHVIGGFSLPGRITIYSTKYASTVYDEGKNFRVKVERHQPLRKAFWRFCLASAASLLILFLIIWFLGPHIGVILHWVLKWSIAAVVAISILIQVIIFPKLKSWHGAEHKAITAFRTLRRFDLAAIKSASPISPFCGGRYYIILLFTATLAYLICFLLKIEIVIVVFAALDVLVKILDGVTRFSISRPIQWCNHLLQKFVTTSEPSDTELQAAHYCLRALIEVEQKENNSSPR
ncbi:MAG: hypothetical protein A2745_02995 [Candidatus Harrisonbacteria bacterium RIFCSPHIGHO2_01_FULL_44_13]|uniref:DUF1385 domain-containing protein n=1 Tax=Candidatus Harrisonbacteria bacterium RIFCSPLOWO2_01_FULL_44_18 TaxID=1798407 RepID=A0A1G1ZM72_9BACT|nr:MAG: hypothetical protein A2745_02995 [Candidatus Harrisonbacteria bacterium RIFCSPHIGHO2_01_FULL_44_13]OGY65748.1 MAG: hypothetical protein A3A16_04020 [Candidatus Harrisonbacteria bacterium RIFCSPLOWO2_01_FULL_44_18]